QQVRFAQDLESIADPQDLTAIRCEPGDGLHDRAKAGDSTATQVIAVREAAWQDHAVVGSKARQPGIFVPQHNYLLSKVLLQGVLHIAITIRTGENNDSKLHRRQFFRSPKVRFFFEGVVGSRTAGGAVRTDSMSGFI